ncbi:MAG: hypothetical protein WC812_04825 [Candidatus Pacearchaeota archaeon]|jgi:hypothetical protein
MKFLVRGTGEKKGSFLEATLEEEYYKIPRTPTDIEVDPRKLIHFGTDLVDIRSSIDIQQHIEKMEESGVDYLYISEGEDVDFAQAGKRLATITAYIDSQEIKDYYKKDIGKELIDWNLIIEIEKGTSKRMRGHTARIRDTMISRNYTIFDNEKILDFYLCIKNENRYSRNFGKKSFDTLEKYLKKINMID